MYGQFPIMAVDYGNVDMDGNCEYEKQTTKNKFWRYKMYKYRFKTKAVDDYRPLVDMKDIQMPYWCTGFAADGTYATIVCYLPKSEDLFKYWDDAYDVDKTSVDAITYTDRFPKPNWIKER